MSDEIATDQNVSSNHDADSIFNPVATNKKLGEMITSFHLPSWITTGTDGTQRQCLLCEADLTPSAVRTVSLCLNAQHIGDIQVEILCPACYASYFLHFRKVCTKTSEFCFALLGSVPKADPVPLTKIGPSENNLADAIVADTVGTTTTSSECACNGQCKETTEGCQCQS